MTSATLLLDEVLGRAYWAAVAAGERQSAVDLARDALAEGHPPLALLDLVCAAQARVGQLWQDGHWTIAQEHVATSISEDVVAVIGTSVHVPPRRGSVVSACVDGEWHALPSRVLAEALRLDGWRVHQVGASVPATALAALVDHVGPDVVALSCSVSTALRRARSMVEVSRAAGTPVLVGGRGFGEAGRWGLRLGATAWAPDAAAAVALVGSADWPRFVDPAPALELPDADADLVDADADRLADSAGQVLLERWPAAAAYSDLQRRHTVDDLRQVARFLAAALLVDDPALLEQFLHWTADVLGARKVALPGLLAGLDALAEQLRTGPRARDFLERGVASLRLRGEFADAG